jgi:imidazoleglycerol phosphate dehydratase HisB
VPLDEALSRVVVDLSGRPGLSFMSNSPAPDRPVRCRSGQ